MFYVNVLKPLRSTIAIYKANKPKICLFSLAFPLSLESSHSTPTNTWRSGVCLNDHLGHVRSSDIWPRFLAVLRAGPLTLLSSSVLSPWNRHHPSYCLSYTCHASLACDVILNPVCQQLPFPPETMAENSEE